MKYTLPRGSAYRPAWRFNLAKILGGGGDRNLIHASFDKGPDPMAVAVALQQSEEENVEDLDLGYYLQSSHSLRCCVAGRK